jgi:putative transposon-encoded protein
VLVVEAELNEAVTPVGTPEADKVTLPPKAFCGVTVTVLVPLAPWTTVTLVGNADSVKSGAGAGWFTVRETVAV